MTRRALLAPLFLLATTPLFAQTADLSVAVFAPKTANPGEQVKYAVEVANAGPDAAKDIQIEPLGGRTDRAFCFVPFIDILAPGTHASVSCYMPIPQSGGGTVGATVSFAGTDPNPANNTATAIVQAIEGPDLAVQLSAPIVVDPGLPFRVGVQLLNSGLFDAHDTVVTIDVPIGSRIVEKPDNCTDTGGRLVCAFGTLAARASRSFSFSLTAPEPQSSFGAPTLTLTADVAGREAEAHPENNHASVTTDVYRMFWVTNVEDGSLRGAIQNANSQCSGAVRCKIGFQIYQPPGSGGFHTIRVRSPLPRITAPVVIDGTTQARYVGDTNPDGPEIFIDGSGLPAGTDGFEADACFSMSSLAIGNFPGAAVFVGTPGSSTPTPCIGSGERSIHDMYIGVDASGTKAAPNGRGVVYDTSGGITNSVISGNVRSGVWIGRAASFTISGNKIGLDAKGSPLGNGASGVYVGPLARDVNVHDNFIAFNHDFGIAVHPGAYATYIPANAIYANWQIGIDVGIDGPTPEKSHAPAIVSAHYDPITDTTVITALVTPATSFPAPTLHFYAADAPHASGFGDGQYFLGVLQYIQPPYDRPVALAAKGDLQGKWVCATETINYYNGFLVALGAAPFGDFGGLYSTTSEFSRAVPVQ